MQSFSTLVLVAAIAACRSAPAEEPQVHVPDYELVGDELDLPGLEAHLAEGYAAVEDFFGAPFLDSFTVEVLPDREAFTASFPPEWGMPDTECWMVAAGVETSLRILAPRVWSSDACEHDATDALHVRGIVVHELVHVFHGQRNPTHEFVGAEDIGWFLEGIAILAAGQLEEGHAASALQAVESGLVPAELESAWSGPHRYGVSGTLARFVDELLGREQTLELLSATREEEILAAVGLSEEELLAEWAAYVEATVR